MSFSCSFWRFPKENSLVICSTGLKRNAVIVSAGEGFPMLFLSILWNLSGDWCVVMDLLLAGIWWWSCGEGSLFFKVYRFFICVESKIITSVESGSYVMAVHEKRSKYFNDIFIRISKLHWFNLFSHYT